MAFETRATHERDIGQGGESSIPKTIFSQYPPAQFTVGGRTYAFPVLSIRETGGNRLVPRERPYRDGVKIDDTGGKGVGWVMECQFENSIEDPGVSGINQGLPLYPDVLNAIISLFDVHETGDLVVPTVGKRRARAAEYSRIETHEARDSGVLSLTFMEDNEDSVRELAPPSASGNARALAESTTFDAQSVGAWNESLNDLYAFVSDLEDLVNAPGEVVQTIQQQSIKIQSKVKWTLQSFQRASRPGRDLFLDPSNSRTERKMTMQREMAARAAYESRRGRPRIIAIVFREQTSLFRVAVIVGQSFEDLLIVNPLIDPFFIPPMTPVSVFASEELLHGQRNSAA